MRRLPGGRRPGDESPAGVRPWRDAALRPRLSAGRPVDAAGRRLETAGRIRRNTTGAVRASEIPPPHHDPGGLNMGGTRWSDDHYRERARLRAKAGKDAFEYDHDVRAGKVAAEVHQKMNPFGVTVRESRDSEAHPTSHAVGVLFDVTGSMQSVPKILQANLPKLMSLLIRKGYLEHPQILIGAIGDATCDQAPLQIGQFESGIEIEEDLAKLYLEGGGGGHITESYELAMYFMARHTSLDCFEKRHKRGYLFLIGDELPYGKVKKNEVAEV